MFRTGAKIRAGDKSGLKQSQLAITLFKVNKTNTRTGCEICLKLPVMPYVLTVNSIGVVLVSLFLNLNIYQ